MEMLAKDLKIEKPSDWYKVGNLKQIGNNSLHKLLSLAYPEYRWLPWKFTSNKVFWSDVNNWKIFLEYAAKELNVKEMKDWYNVKTEVIIKIRNIPVLI